MSTLHASRIELHSNPDHGHALAQEVPEATSRYANRFLERSALQARLQARRPGGAQPGATAIDTGWASTVLSPWALPGVGAAQAASARRVRRMMAPLPGGRTIAIDVVPATVRFEAADLGRLLYELVDNAVRHAPPGATVRVRGAQGDGGYQLSVTNPGERMPRWALASLRVPRTDSGPATAPAPALALGLPIAALLAALNDTRLEALRAAGRPNTLRVIVPTC
ncbi:MAG: ATP-binding protein [Burkholderiaceae bacterium]